MKELMKRDFLSIRRSLKYTLITIIGVWLVLYFLSLTMGIHAGYFNILTLFMTVVISFELVENIFQQEHISGVRERVEQLPVRRRDLVLSRYLGSLMIVVAVFALNTLFLTFNFFIFERNLPLFLPFVKAFFIAFHLVLFIVTIFLFVSFIFDYAKGVWAGRAAAIAWIFFFFFAPGLYWSRTLNISSTPSEQFLKILPAPIFLLAILLFILSYFLCLFVYRSRRRTRHSALFILLLVSLVMFMGIGVHVENKVSRHNEAVISEIMVERVALDIFNINEEGEKPLYQVLFNMEFAGSELEWSVKEDTVISYEVPEVVSELIHLEDGEFSIINTSGSFLREEANDGDMVWFAKQEAGPLLLSEEELAVFLEEFDERDFRFTIQSPWLRDKVIGLDWH